MKSTFHFDAKSWLIKATGTLNRIKGELAWVATGQTVAAVAALAGVRLMTGLLSPTAYGELALGMTVALLIVQSLFGPITNGISRFFAPSVEAGEIDAYLQATRRLALSVTAVVVVLAVAMSVGMLVLGQQKWILLGIATLLFSVLTGYNGIISIIQNAARQRSMVALHQGIGAWLRFALAALLILWFGPSSAVAIIGYTAAITLVLFSQYLFFRRMNKVSGKQTSAGKWHRQILTYSWPFYTWSLFTWAQVSSDRWALALFSSTKDVGLYAALYQLGNNPIAMTATMALQLLAPIFYQRAGNGTDEQRNARVGKLGWHLTLLTLGITVAVAGIGSIFHVGIFRILVAEKYASVSPLLPYTLLASGIFAASQLIELSLMSQMRARMLIFAKITAALVGVALNFAGARWYGVSGVVAAGVAISVFYFFWMVWLSKRVLFQPSVAE